LVIFADVPHFAIVVYVTAHGTVTLWTEVFFSDAASLDAYVTGEAVTDVIASSGRSTLDALIGLSRAELVIRAVAVLFTKPFNRSTHALCTRRSRETFVITLTTSEYGLRRHYVLRCRDRWFNLVSGETAPYFTALIRRAIA
jgi:hypothetical protein